MSIIDLSDLSIFDNHEKKLLRNNWMDFKEILLKNKIDYFYHVTDQSNIESIKKEGLCSCKFCKENDIKINCYGSNNISREIDQKKRLDNFVRISIFKNNPLVSCFISDQRILDPCFLKIDPRIIYLESTLFSDINAADSNTTVGNSIENFKKINFGLFKNDKNMNSIRRKQLQAEILIRTWIPDKFISNLKLYG